MNTTTTWPNLVKSALLGTERQPLAALPNDGALGALLAQLNTADAEVALLGAAGIVALYERAGNLPLVDDRPLPAPCDTADLPECSATARRHLVTMLDGQFAGALPEWLSALTAGEKRVPSECLPALLDLGKQQEAMQASIMPALGKRGRWLAAQNANWDFAVAGDDAALWQTGTIALRRSLLRRERASDPARAREWLAATWSADAPADRAAFLAAFEIGLSDADEPFLEQALSDSRKEVRKVAADLLARLPGSALCQRMAERVEALVRFKNGRLGRKVSIEVTLPDKCDAAMQRDGIEPKPRAGTGEKAWWLIQMLGASPLAMWRAAGGKNAAQLIEAAEKSEWQLTLLEGWALAAARQHDAEWAEALLRRGIELKEPLNKEDVQPVQRLNVLTFIVRSLPRVLVASRREIVALDLFKIERDLTQDSVFILPLLAEFDHAWSESFSRAWLERLCLHARKKDAALDPRLQSLMEEYALHMAPALAGEATRGWPEGDEARVLRWKEHIDELTALLQFRAEMLKAVGDDRQRMGNG